MNKVHKIKCIVCYLQHKIKGRVLDIGSIQNATKKLSSIGYMYDSSLFPEINTDEKFCTELSSGPISLAEALLWKMGKWEIYKDFVRNYEDSSITKTTSVVFSAFAKHLRDRANPIYDQHALRAMLAINTNLTGDEKYKCKSVLFKSKGPEGATWKDNMSGKESINCYEIYVKAVNSLASDIAFKSALDRLLMPLGQALKTNCRDYKEFESICSCGDGNCKDF